MTPSGTRAMHWYRPTVRLLRAVMTSFPRSTWIPSTSSDPASSFPFSLQVRFTRGGSTTQPRLTGPPSFWTMEAGCTVTCRDSPAQREKMGIRKLCETQQQKRQRKKLLCCAFCIPHRPSLRCTFPLTPHIPTLMFGDVHQHHFFLTLPERIVPLQMHLLLWRRL